MSNTIVPAEIKKIELFNCSINLTAYRQHNNVDINADGF